MLITPIHTKLSDFQLPQPDDDIGPFSRTVYQIVNLLQSGEIDVQHSGRPYQLSSEENNTWALTFIDECLKNKDHNKANEMIAAIQEYPLVDLGCGVRFTHVPKALSSVGLKYYMGLDSNFGNFWGDFNVPYDQLRERDLTLIDPEMQIATIPVEMKAGLLAIKSLGLKVNIFASAITDDIESSAYGSQVSQLIPEVVPVGGFCALYNSTIISKTLPGIFLDEKGNEKYPKVDFVENPNGAPLPVWHAIGLLNYALTFLRLK